MLIVALVLAVIGLAALVTAVVTSSELVAWVCIAASVVGVVLLIVDAIRERQHLAPAAVVAPEPESSHGPAVAYPGEDVVESTYSTFDADYPPDDLGEDEPSDGLVSEDPEPYPSRDDEPELQQSADQPAVHPAEATDRATDSESDAPFGGADEPDGAERS